MENIDKERRDEIVSLIDKKRLSEAIRACGSLPSLSTMTELSELHRGIAEEYEYMSRYALDAVNDPSRTERYGQLGQRLKSVVNAWLRRRYAFDSSTLYYSKVRYEMASNETTRQLVDTVRKYLDALSSAMFSGDLNPKDRESGTRMRVLLENAQTRLFNHIWITHPLNNDDGRVISELLTSSVIPAEVKQSVVSGLTLGGLEWRDDRRLGLLLEAYCQEDNKLSMTALTGVIALLQRHGAESIETKTQQRLLAAKERPGWDRDVQLVTMQMVAARDTERITSKISNEIIPGLMKLQPELKKRVSEGGMLDLSSIEENPEWQDILEKSGIDKKIQELAEIQEDGGDVMMASFSHMKHFPFFNEVANWFLPFNGEHTVVFDSTGRYHDEFVKYIDSNDGFCDSDKYSLACMCKSIPDEQLEMFLGQFKQQSEAIEQARGDTTEETERKAAARDAVRSMYRFFRLFRRKGEFRDPFKEPFRTDSLEVLSNIFGEADILRLIAEFFFKRGHHESALFFFRRVADLESPDAVAWQKMGYSLQIEGRQEEALEAYQRSEYLNPDNVWTLRRIATLLRQMGKTEESVEYYRRVAEQQPDSPSAAMNLGAILLEIDKVDDALPQLYKAEFLEAKRPEKARRLLSWGLLLKGDTEKARQYCLRLLSGNTEANDYLNMGHLEMMEGHPREGAGAYRRALEMLNGDTDKFLTICHEDFKRLGIDPVLGAIVADKVINHEI